MIASTESLGEALPLECSRNERLLVEYARLPDDAGAFAIEAIQADLDLAHTAIAESDVVKMLVAWDRLRGNK